MQGTPQSRGGWRGHRMAEGGTGSDDSMGMFLTVRSSSCLATITTALNPATVLLCLSIRNKKKRKKKSSFPDAWSNAAI